MPAGLLRSKHTPYQQLVEMFSIVMAAMASQRASGWPVGDQLWELLEPLIPPPSPAKNGRIGRPRVDDRAALAGILFVAEHGVAWKKRPTELGCGSGITCWRRLRTW